MSNFSFSHSVFKRLVSQGRQKVSLCGNGLTHCQTTNFRLFQNERVCRRQFQIWQKRQKVIQMGRKHFEKRRNCVLRAISPFSTVFPKSLFPRGVKRCHCMGMGLLFTKQFWLLTTLKKKPFENIIGKGENTVNQGFLLFEQCFLPFLKEISICKSHLFCHLQMLSIWRGQKFYVIKRVNHVLHIADFGEKFLLKTLKEMEKNMVSSISSFHCNVC